MVEITRASHVIGRVDYFYLGVVICRGGTFWPKKLVLIFKIVRAYCLESRECIILLHLLCCLRHVEAKTKKNEGTLPTTSTMNIKRQKSLLKLTLSVWSRVWTRSISDSWNSCPLFPFTCCHFFWNSFLSYKLGWMVNCKCHIWKKKSKQNKTKQQYISHY